jgi:NDP-sugar pyrophosphorylase family protein
MINFLIPLATSSKFFESSEYPYPVPLVEIFGKPMIQHVIENLSHISEKKRFIFILREEDCTRYHLDSTLRLLAGEDAVIIKLQRETKGAACSALLAIDLIANEQPLIIANGDQLFDVDLEAYLSRFRDEKAAAGCLYFESVHPRWSYVRLENNDIIEVAVNRPISFHATAGFYYFASGMTFVDAAKQMILGDVMVNDQFYVAPVFNELVLKNRHLRAYSLPNETYHTFYSPQKIKEFELGRE